MFYRMLYRTPLCAIRKSKKSSHPFAQFCQGELSHIPASTFFKNGRGQSENYQNSLKINLKQRLETHFCNEKRSQSKRSFGTRHASFLALFELSREPKRWTRAPIFHKSACRNMTENSFRIDRKSSMQGSIEK